MSATETLATTTLAQNLGTTDRQVKLISTAGIFPGMRLFVDGEVLAVISVGVDPWVNVQRGSDATQASAHIGGATVYIARGDQLYTDDPAGRPRVAVLVSPWINIVNGTVWLPQGDEQPTNTANRWWAQVTSTHDVGSLGVRTTTDSPTVSS